MSEPSEVTHAIEIVAMHVIASQLEDVGEMWDSYPELGEFDWEWVCDRVKMLTANLAVTHADYLAAYALLEARAEHV